MLVDARRAGAGCIRAWAARSCAKVKGEHKYSGGDEPLARGRSEATD
eukprot:CAMPEP_0178989020 /NCGR_PEP_ID=MMETSP0795-20121207/4126_1 /TAXON_ID=88552 /ORGANISM="Amoebophrya sp., Strain Ameob2" /LENGTH=46 /DNA_ID= /DNA_START= /DNA_END= /DNA_ORIENTATION=